MKSDVSRNSVLRRLRAGEKLRTGYCYNQSAIFDNGDKVSHKVMNNLRRANLILIDIRGYVRLAAADMANVVNKALQETQP